MKRLLVVDDDAAIRGILRRWLDGQMEVVEASDAPSGIAAMLREVPDAMLLDVVMPGGGGPRVLAEARRYLPGCVIVGMSGEARLPDFVAMFRSGLCDFLMKPFTHERLRAALLRAQRVQALRAENALLRDGEGRDPLLALVGESAPMLEVKQRLRSLAPSPSTVLVVGATGTGKDLAARAVHELSPRSGGPFLAIPCGAIPDSLVEVELFGHSAFAFTGAARARRGRFEEAAGGTLVLDDIANVPPTLQARLLRVLDQRLTCRVGETAEREVDVRLIATSIRPLDELVARGQLREDLAHRLGGLHVELPALVDRGDDLLLLSAHLLEREAARQGRMPKLLSAGALRALREHSWPGNVRELANALERAVLRSGERRVIEARDLGLLATAPRASVGSSWPLPEEGLDLPALLRDVEDELVRQALARSDGHQERAAALLRIGRSSLQRKMARLS